MEILTNRNDRLLFAIPKKGRLHNKCVELLAGIDVQFRMKARHDICFATNLPIVLIFLPAADIPKYVGEGNVDLGITGLDMVVESGEENNLIEETRLGFGKCKLMVQVPVAGNLQSAQQLVGKRIVTSFENTARKYFSELEKQHNSTAATHIKCVNGSVEVACTLGLADGIVDLVESGETMRAAGLHAIETILETEAALVSNPNSQHKELVKKLTTRIKGIIAADKYVLCQYNVHRSKLEAAVKITPGRVAPAVSPLEEKDWVEVSSMIIKQEHAEVMDQLSEIGAKDIIIFKISNCRV